MYIYMSCHKQPKINYFFSQKMFIYLSLHPEQSVFECSSKPSFPTTTWPLQGIGMVKKHGSCTVKNDFYAGTLAGS